MDAESVSATPAERTVILHVDDSPADRYRRRRALESAGFRVVDVETGTAARSIFGVERPDLVLLDVRLPDTTGFDLTRKIKTEATLAGRDVAVVLISAYFTESEFRVRGLESGADAYLSEPVPDSELVATVRAVLRRLEETKAARKNERLLDALFEYIPEGITIADAPDVKIRRVSRYGMEMTGRTPEALINIPSSEHPGRWSIFLADGATPARAEELPLARAVTSGAVITDEEWVLRRPDGQHRTVLCNAGPIRDPDGRLTGGVIAWRDITARKQTEEALQRLTSELQLANQAKNDFLATVAHEMRQPIQASLAALAVMKARQDRRRGERARDVIERQLDQIARLSDDLLDATRIVRGQVALERQPHDLCAVVRHSLETMRATLQQAGLKVVTEIPSTSLKIDGDAFRLQQVFVNVLSNAARYTAAGGQVAVSIESAGGTAIVRIADTGEGIDPEHLPLIFDLFVRGNTSPGGFGIGLAVARSLIEAHGGTVGARSEGPGKGSEFVVTLPLVRKAT